MNISTVGNGLLNMKSSSTNILLNFSTIKSWCNTQNLVWSGHFALSCCCLHLR